MRLLTPPWRGLFFRKYFTKKSADQILSGQPYCCVTSLGPRIPYTRNGTPLGTPLGTASQLPHPYGCGLIGESFSDSPARIAFHQIDDFAYGKAGRYGGKEVYVIFVGFRIVYAYVGVVCRYFLNFHGAIRAYSFVEYGTTVFGRHDNMIFGAIDTVPLFSVLHILPS